MNLFFSMLIKVLSQGAPFANILSEGTLPDGYYHEDHMWTVFALALAVPAHYLLMQYDGMLFKYISSLII